MSDEQVTVALVPPLHIQMVWEQVEAFLVPAVEKSNGRWSMDYLYGTLVSGQKHLWVVFDETKSINCVAVTSVVDYPLKKMLSIEFLGGNDIESWVFKLLDVLNRFAWDAGCGGIEATARFGFWKWLEKDGFDKAYTVFEKRFEP
jgi:hypothetical protein